MIPRAALNTAHANCRAATIASARHQRTEVAGAITQNGHSFLRQGGEDEFTCLTYRQGFQRHGVYDFRIEVVLADVGAVLHLAFVADTGAHDLRKPIDVISLQAQTLLNLLAHVLCPGLSAKGSDTQLDIFLADSQFVHCLGEVQGIGRGAGNACDAEVAYEFQVLFRVTRSRRNAGGTQVFHSVVSTQAAREEAIAVCYRERIVASDTKSRKTAGHALAPYTYIFTRIAHNGGIARGATGGVHADNLALRSCLQAEGIVVAQILLGGEGEFPDILYRLDVIRTDIHFL